MKYKNTDHLYFWIKGKQYKKIGTFIKPESKTWWHFIKSMTTGNVKEISDKKLNETLNRQL